MIEEMIDKKAGSNFVKLLIIQLLPIFL